MFFSYSYSATRKIRFTAQGKKRRRVPLPLPPLGMQLNVLLSIGGKGERGEA